MLAHLATTRWTPWPPSKPVRTSELESNSSPDWLRYKVRYHPDEFFRVQSCLTFYFPVSAPNPAISEQWIEPAEPLSSFTNEHLGMLIDIWTPMMESFRPESLQGHDGTIKIAREQKAGTSATADAAFKAGWTSPYYYPTLSVNLEIKKVLPQEGVRWLYVRASTKQIQQGKMDVEVLILDDQGDLVALSHQVVLVVDTGARLNGPKI